MDRIVCEATVPALGDRPDKAVTLYECPCGDLYANREYHVKDNRNHQA